MTTTYYGGTRLEIKPLLPARIESILEIGCGSGGTLSWIGREWSSKRCVGLELHPAAADAARSKGLEIVQGNVESMSADSWAKLGSFDVVLALDLLEHLVDPWRLVEMLRAIVKPGGTFIASIPNVRSLHVLWPLAMRGEWRYEDSGLLDRTHLRFFTKRSAVELVEKGFTVKSVERCWSNKARLLSSIAFHLFDDFLTTQYLVRGEPKTADPANAQ
jgi:2-polyprenyl-3-methyl-5-hydroxy-6-metoxy-1,4-benzoquinol methylase